MTDIVITPSDVQIVTPGNFAEGFVVQAVAAGDACRRVSGTTYDLAESGDTAEKADGVVIALSSGAEGQLVKFAANGRLAIGGGVELGDVLALSATPGKLAPISDLVPGDYFTLVAVGVGDGIIELRPLVTGEQFTTTTTTTTPP